VWPDGWKPEDATARRRDGLTLFEMLVVLAILGMLVSLVIGLGRHADAAGKRGRAQADLAVWQHALTRWYLAFDEYPAVDGTVTNLLAVSISTPTTNLLFEQTQTTAWRLTDPWGALYRYYGSNQTYTIWSLGPDGRDDTPDDVLPAVGN